MAITTLNTSDLMQEREEIQTDIELHEDAKKEGETDSSFFMDDGDLHDAQERLKALDELLDEVGREARYGVMLIREDGFEEYAREVASEFAHGYENVSEDWPFCHIDWEAAAEALKQDYTEIEFDGDTWLYRA